MTLTNPALSDLAAAAYRQDALRATESARRLARADPRPRPNRTLFGVCRFLIGAALIGAGERLQGARRARTAVPRSIGSAAPETPAPTSW